MDLDADCLLDARVENVERLALALGVRLPPYRGDHRKYARALVRAVLKGLEDDRRRQRRGDKLGYAAQPVQAN